MLPRFRYLAFGTVLALAAIGLGVLISWLLDLNWVVISILLLVLLILLIYSNTMSGAGGGPTMRPAALAGGSNPYGVSTTNMSLDDLKQVDHMANESDRKTSHAVPVGHKYRWIALPSMAAILVILVSLFV